MMTFPIVESKTWLLVSWDDDIPNIWKVKKHVPNHQPLLTTSSRCQWIDWTEKTNKRNYHFLTANGVFHFCLLWTWHSCVVGMGWGRGVFWGPIWFRLGFQRNSCFNKLKPAEIILSTKKNCMIFIDFPHVLPVEEWCFHDLCIFCGIQVGLRIFRCSSATSNVPSRAPGRWKSPKARRLGSPRFMAVLDGSSGMELWMFIPSIYNLWIIYG